MKAGSMARADANNLSGRVGHQPTMAEVLDLRSQKLTYSESP